MKRILKNLLWIACVTVCAAPFSPAMARQGEMAVEISGDVATEPKGDFGATAGFTAGFGYEIIDELQLRGDVSYYRWSDDGIDLDRVPLVIGARKYYQTPLRELKAFGQGGLEISFDNSNKLWPSRDDTNVGVALGGGIEYTIAPKFTVGSDLRFHIINNWYTTIGFGLGYHF
jgi:opacity protein-like surface antigen